jgi:hypothetical protein
MKGIKTPSGKQVQVNPFEKNLPGRKPKTQGKLSEPSLLDIPSNTSTSQISAMMVNRNMEKKIQRRGRKMDCLTQQD